MILILGAGTACTYIKFYLIFHELQYSILFCSKGGLTDASHTKNPLYSNFAQKTTNQSRLLVPFHLFGGRHTRPKLKKDSSDTFFSTSVIFFSSCCKTTHLRMEFAYFCRLSQSRTKAMSC